MNLAQLGGKAMPEKEKMPKLHTMKVEMSMPKSAMTTKGNSGNYKKIPPCCPVPMLKKSPSLTSKGR
jgi:hypothetical protein